MSPENKILNGLWIGNKLSKVELLTISSFLGHGHSFRLWIYEPLITTLPPGVEIADASQIIPREKIFSYKNENKYGHGKGSVAGFSDIFRYKLLYEKGGWWVDMDITCLNPFDFPEPYFFRNHHELIVVGNVMKCPKQSELMKLCYEEAISSVDEYNTNWHKPIEILNKHIAALQLKGFIRSDVSNPDQWDKTSRFVDHGDSFPPDWYFIHWQNEEWRSRNISKQDFYFKSTLAALLGKYGLFTIPASTMGRVANRIRHFSYF
jgi:hypothetical protein